MKNTLSLNRNTLFKRLYYRGKSYGSPYFVLYVLRTNSQVNRIGFTVSKKIGKAVWDGIKKLGEAVFGFAKKLY